LKTDKRFLVPAIASGLVFVLIGLAVLYKYDPASHFSFYPGCAFHSLTGLYCPGCGTTRALHQLLHGHFRAALHLNPLAVIALPFLGYFFVSELCNQNGAKRLPRLFVSPVWGWALVGIVVAYWITRNIPVYPFTLMSP
jgi:hypothetical protein